MRPPVLFITVAFAAGIAAGVNDVGAWGVGFSVLSGVLLLWRRAPLAAACGVMVVAGTWWGGAAVRERAAECVGVWGRGSAATRAATVRLRDFAPADGGVLEGEAVGGPCGGTIRIRWPEGHPARGGTVWVVAGRWLGDGSRGVLAARRVRQVDAEPRGRGALRGRAAERSLALFGSRAPLVDALVIGRRAELDAALRERYSRSGLTHLLSISGLHVAFFAAWLGVLLQRLRLGARPRFAAATLVMLGYVWVLGFPAPAARPAVMLALLDVARLTQRVVAPRGTIALAALLVLFVDPWAIQSIGAWLSVSAVAAVIWAARATARSPRVVRMLAPAAAATLLTAPLTAFTFGTVAPVGILANVVAIPLAGLAVPGLMAALVASSDLLAAGAGLCLALLDVVAGAAAAVPGGNFVTAAGWPSGLVWLGVLAVAWWLWNAPRRPWLVTARLAFVAACVALAALIQGFGRLSECRCLTVHFLDVGQGDAVVLRTPAGRWVVVDGGPRSALGDAGRRVVVPFLRRHRARVAAVVATHGHADHIGGLSAVFDAFDPALVLEPGTPVPDAGYLAFLAAVEGDGAAWRAARRGDRLELDGVVFEVLSPDSAWAAGQVDLNEQSVVLLVRYGATRLVLTGDAGAPTEAWLAGRVGRVDVLKVGHHGSRGATSPAWLAELAPGDAVISVGARNRYGHPAAEVLERMATRGVRVHRTDRAGTITLESDGHGVRIHGSHHD